MGGIAALWLTCNTLAFTATIGGLLPLELEGSSLYSPLAWVIIGGLVASTVLARLVTPWSTACSPPRCR